MEITLGQVILAMEMASDAYTLFLDLETGETVFLPDRFETGESDEELEELLEEDPDRFLAFPSKYDIHEYQIMTEFIAQLPSEQTRGELAVAIRGSGAFRRFRETLRNHDLEAQWYGYRDKAIQEIAVNWCRENGVSLRMT